AVVVVPPSEGVAVVKADADAIADRHAAQGGGGAGAVHLEDPRGVQVVPPGARDRQQAGARPLDGQVFVDVQLATRQRDGVGRAVRLLIAEVEDDGVIRIDLMRIKESLLAALGFVSPKKRRNPGKTAETDLTPTGSVLTESLIRMKSTLCDLSFS